MGAALNGARASDPGVAREWRVDPWRESRGRAALALAASLGGCAAVAAMRPGLLPALGLSVVVVAALAPAFVPVACRVDDEGVGVQGPLGWRRRAWRELRRLDLVPAGALFSPYGRRHPLDPHRALLLPLPAGERDELAAWLRATWERHVR